MKEPKTPSVLPRLKVGGAEAANKHCDRNEQPVPDCDHVVTTHLIILKYLPGPPTRSGDVSKKERTLFNEVLSVGQSGREFRKQIGIRRFQARSTRGPYPCLADESVRNKNKGQT